MISFELLEQVATELEAFRGNGRENVLFDSRDRGNYGGYNWDETAQMLREADPTGLALGLLLDAMIEATIAGSKVQLARVLQEEGFVAELQKILHIKDRLQQALAWPALAFTERIEAALAQVSPDFGMPTTLEIALCLRDAIYCMREGLTLRWLECSGPARRGPVPFGSDVCRYPDIAAFQEALQRTLPCGAHLARIGAHATAIGIKQPGRIAYLSSLSIDVRRGAMVEDRAPNSNLAENFDLDTPVQRYPVWAPYKPSGYTGSSIDVDAVRRMALEHPIDHITKLPRDRLLWLAMVVEMATQKMASHAPGTVVLVESLGRALPDLTRSAGLPVPWTPNWQLGELNLEEMFQALQLSDWEQRFLRPALKGRTASDFLPIGESNAGILLDTGETVARFPGEFEAGSRDIRERAVEMVSASASWVGSKAEIETARRELFGSNLANWLMAWGQMEFDRQAEDIVPWFEARLKANMPKALTSRCVRLKHADYRPVCDANLYSQSPTHRTYRARCVFSPKHEVTDIALFVPADSADLVEMLGLSGESDLPAFLHGWQRQSGWTTEENHHNSPIKPPFECRMRWRFAEFGHRQLTRNMLCAIVQFNRANLAAQGLQLVGERIAPLR